MAMQLSSLLQINHFVEKFRIEKFMVEAFRVESWGKKDKG